MGGFSVSTTWLQHWDGIHPNCWRSGMPAHPVRRDVANQLRRMLRQPGIGGYVVRGTLGNGKRELIRAVFQQSEQGVKTFWVSGSRYGKELDYGAIHFLLTGLPEDRMNSPVAVYAHLQEYFAVLAPKPFIVVEQVGLLDPLTIAVLAQLVGNGIARLLVIDDRVHEIPEDLAVLLRTGTIKVCHLNSLSAIETRAQLHSMLDAQVSHLTSFRFWQYCAGSSQMLHAVVRDCLDAGAFQVDGGVAALRHPTFPIGGRTEQHVLSRVERLSRRQRQILEFVAIHATLPEGAEEFERDLDILFSRELLLHDGKTWVIPNPAISRTLAFWQGKRGPDLPEPRGDGHQHRVVARTRTGAESDSSAPCAELRNKVSELVTGESLTEAADEIQEFLQQREPQAVELHDALLADAKLVLLELHLASGHMQEARNVLEQLEPNGAQRLWETLDTCQQHLTLALTAEYLARINNHVEAQSLVNGLLAHVNSATAGNQIVDDLRFCMGPTLRALIITCLILGDWAQCRRLTQMVLEGYLNDNSVIAFAETIQALMLAMDGRAAESRIVCAALRLQLQYSGTDQELHLVETIAHLGMPATEDIVPLDPELGRATDIDAQWSFEICISQFLLAQGSEWVDDKHAAWAETQGEKFLAGLLLAQQVCQGRLELAPQLEAMQWGHEHELAKTLCELAQGAQERDTRRLTAALGNLARLGYPYFASDTSRGIYSLLTAKQKRQIVRHANTWTASVRPASLGIDSHTKLARLSELTDREKFVASAAASGLSNMEIADQASVSVRTVEGHLYQVYSKLGISKRQDLMEMAGAARK